MRTDPQGAEWAGRIGWIIDQYEGGNAAAAARRAGITPQALTKLARGEGGPSGDTLAAILRAYPRVSADWLVLGRGPRERAPDSLAAVRELLEAVQAVLDDARRRFGV